MLILKPIFVPKIWGGNNLKKIMFPSINQEKIGEVWLVSCIKGFESKINNGIYANKTLKEVWDNHPELFNNHDKNKEFPLLLKILDADQDLSIQLHPDNKYAQTKMNLAFGKAECWYVIDCKEKQKLILGHKGKTLEKTKELVLNKNWDKFIRKINIKKGDLFDIKPGTVHAICAGTIIFELQQASDVTFRLYDYDRLENGKPRSLHIKESLEIISAPQIYKKTKVIKKFKLTKNKSQLNFLISNKYFMLYELELDNEKVNISQYFKDKDYLIITCISGEVLLNNTSLNKGDSVILVHEELKTENIEFSGIAKIFISIAN